jgi:hypothetical protein
MELDKLTIEELLNYEKAALLVCSRYEKSLKMYDGSIRDDGPDFKNFEKYNKIYLKIFEEIEKRVGKI